MRLQVLLSTMNNCVEDLLESSNLCADLVVINQCEFDENLHFKNDLFDVIWINSSGRGLSVSRNLAIKSANSDICLLADDDLVYVNDLSKLIVEAFKNNETADVICFAVDGFDRVRKKYWDSSRRLNYLTSMKVSSVQIAFRRSSILDNNLYFNEDFGAGAMYYAGEENIWLWDCFRKGLKIHFEPVKIATLLESQSTWFEGYTNWYFISKGAAFTAMHEFFSPILILQFALRKHKLWKNEVSFKNAIVWMFKGRALYLSEHKLKGNR
jgi:glycosyltransferase involved in cell wall biosynthesis